MFQFPGFAPCIQYRVTVLQTDGLSHSEIRASRDICSYARLIAAYHVLHRLCEPRHPPYALTYFAIILPTYVTQKGNDAGQPILQAVHTLRTRSGTDPGYGKGTEFFITVLLVPTCQTSKSQVTGDGWKVSGHPTHTAPHRGRDKTWRITDSNR